MRNKRNIELNGQNNSDSPYLRGKMDVFLGFRTLLDIIILNLVTSPNYVFGDHVQM
jgi:hypothetical protein